MRNLLLLISFVGIANAQIIIPPPVGDIIGGVVKGNRMSNASKLHFNEIYSGSTAQNNDPRKMNNPDNSVYPIESHLKNASENPFLTASQGNTNEVLTTSPFSQASEQGRTLVSERAVARYLLATTTPLILSAASLGMIAPQFWAAQTGALQQTATEGVDNRIQKNRDNPSIGQAEAAMINCADNVIQKKEDENKADPKIKVPTYREAWEYCEELAREGKVDIAGTVIELGGNAHLASYPSHPIYLMAKYKDDGLRKYFGPNRENEPNILYLSEILTLRKREVLLRESLLFEFEFPELTEIGFGSPTVEQAHKEIDKIMEWMKIYAGDVKYVYNKNNFRKSNHVTDQKQYIPPKARYLALLKAAYSDLMFATGIICKYQNKLYGASDTYVPFAKSDEVGTAENLDTLSPNDMWARLEKEGLAEPLRNRLKNLAAGPLYGVDVALPLAILQLFVSHENPLIEASNGTKKSGAGAFDSREVQIDCSMLNDENEDKISFYLELIEKSNIADSVKVLSPRVRYAMLFAHNIALAQMATEAVKALRMLEAIYGYPKEDNKQIENGEWIAIRDLREILGIAAGFNGDKFKGQPFETAYALRVKDLNELTLALANDLDKVRGTTGSSLGGVGSVSLGGGLPFR